MYYFMHLLLLKVLIVSGKSRLPGYLYGAHVRRKDTSGIKHGTTFQSQSSVVGLPVVSSTRQTQNIEISSLQLIRLARNNVAYLLPCHLFPSALITGHVLRNCFSAMRQCSVQSLRSWFGLSEHGGWVRVRTSI
jgi:hypothetical protein